MLLSHDATGFVVSIGRPIVNAKFCMPDHSALGDECLECLTKGTIFACPSQADASGSWQAYRITSSAWKSTGGGMVRPRACAVLRLMTSSNFVGRSTGKSAGLAPLRILST